MTQQLHPASPDAGRISPSRPRFSPFTRGFDLIRRHRRTFLIFNGVSLGLMAATMIVTAFLPHTQDQTVARSIGQMESTGVFGAVTAGYDSGNLLWAAGITFAVNLAGALGTITLPSLIVPFFGVALTIYRVTQWGVLFSPIDGNWAAFLPHLLTLFIEGTAYVIAAFGVWIHGMKFVAPRRFGLPSRRAGYMAGLRDTLHLYPLVIALLIIGAVYEAFEIIYVVPHLV